MDYPAGIVVFPTGPSFRGALIWSFVMNGGSQTLMMLLMFLLAALLGPEAFGTVAMAMVYVTFIQMFLEQGMEAAIIQRKDLSSEHLNAAFWMVLAGSLALTGASLLLAGWWAGVNQLPLLAPVIAVLSASIPIRGLIVVQQAILKREMDFRSLAIRSNLSVVVGGTAGVTLAFKGAGVWALVAQQLTTGFASLVLLWSLSHWRPAPRFSPAAARDLLGFSTGAFLGRIGVFVNNRSDALLMGIFFGPAAVGLYRLADRVMGLLVDLASRSIQAVALPEFSRLQDERGQLSESVLRCLRISGDLAIPGLAFLAVGSREVMALLGPEWADAAGPLTLLAMVGAIRALTIVTGPLLRGTGRPYAHAALLWSHALPSALAFWLIAVWLRDQSSWEQAMGIAGSRAGLYVLLFLPVNWIIIRGIASLGFGRMLRAVGPALLSAASAVAAISVLRASGPLAEVPEVFRSLATLAVGVLTATPTLVLLDLRLRAMLVGWLKGTRISGVKIS